jgi:hypothetical protein
METLLLLMVRLLRYLLLRQALALLIWLELTDDLKPYRASPRRLIIAFD